MLATSYTVRCTDPTHAFTPSFCSQVLIDIEAATRCDAFIGTFDAGLAKVMLARQVGTQGVNRRKV